MPTVEVQARRLRYPSTMIYLLLGLATFSLLFLLTTGVDRMERRDDND